MCDLRDTKKAGKLHEDPPFTWDSLRDPGPSKDLTISRSPANLRFRGAGHLPQHPFHRYGRASRGRSQPKEQP